jgi:ketosteroid isomerase-like protein
MDDADVFRRFHEAWTENDLNGVLELADPEIVARPVHGWLFTRLEYRGHDGLRQWFHEMKDPWDSFETRVVEVHPTDDGGVMGFLHLVAHRGEETLDARVASFAEFRDGRILTLTARDIWDVQEEMGR